MEKVNSRCWFKLCCVALCYVSFINLIGDVAVVRRQRLSLSIGPI
jgi:hypothetical protein